MADFEENVRRKATGKKEIPLSPIAIEVVCRIDALFTIERSINGKGPEERLAAAKLKALLRKAAERTVEGLWTAIGRCVDLF